MSRAPWSIPKKRGRFLTVVVVSIRGVSGESSVERLHGQFRNEGDFDRCCL